jgi:ABC-type nitrate/sulfonate/bicarbonate transport system permease component
VVFAMPMLAINVASGYRHTRSDLVEMSQSFGVSRRREFWNVRTMAALPAIFAGLRLAVSRAFVGVIVAELLVLTTGLGRLLLASGGQFKGAEMYGIVLVIFTIGILTLGAVGMLERRALRWNDQSPGGSGA